MKFKHGFSVACIILLVAILSCSKGETKMVMAVITGHEKEWQGCIGTDWKTYIKTIPDGNVDYLCGKFSTVGDTISGWWTEGHWNNDVNGFSRNN